MQDLANSLRDLRKTLGKSQQEMADYVGIPQRTWANYESGKTEPRMKVLWVLVEKGHNIPGITIALTEKISQSELKKREGIARAMAEKAPPDTPIDDEWAREIDAEYKRQNPPSRTPVYTRADLENNGNAFVIPLINQKLSAGSGQELPQNDEVTALIPIPSHLAKFGKNIAALTVEGDSMYPTLDRGDMVVCDSCGWSGEGIYALRMGGDGFVKRLTKAPGKLIIISDNPKYPVREEPEGSQDFEIIGRVHCAIKNME